MVIHKFKKDEWPKIRLNRHREDGYYIPVRVNREQQTWCWICTDGKLYSLRDVQNALKSKVYYIKTRRRAIQAIKNMFGKNTKFTEAEDLSFF